MCGSDLFLAILAVFFPPVSVWIKLGICTADSIINIALCCLGYIPGLLHAWYIILKHPEPDYDDPSYEPVPNRRGDVENGNVTYYYVSHQSAPNQGQRGYGTLPPQQGSGQPRQPAPKPQHEQPTAGSSSQGQDESRPPPTYAEAVKGDNKVQSDD
ncbi:putative stress response RCI peptide [Aspergillus stella-maris]|uniref:putative stress response RCI peptide n=1 Tax=Aspergillus stella-maris TaxID=1810926 RepID=UPI003CCDA993